MSWLAQNFDFTRGDTIVRLIAGIFLVPHIYAKVVGSGTAGFFKAAGFKPPAFWMYVACVIEASVAVSFRRQGIQGRQRPPRQSLSLGRSGCANKNSCAQKIRAYSEPRTFAAHVKSLKPWRARRDSNSRPPDS